MRAFIQNMIKSNMMIKNGTLFRKNLIVILLVATLPILFISVSVHRVGTQQIDTLINESHEMLLTKISEKIKSELSDLEVSVRYWSYNPLFGGYLESMDTYKQLSNQQVLDSLSAMERSNPLVSKIELYLHANSFLFSNYDGIFSEIVNVKKKNKYEAMFEQKEDLYWYYGLDEDNFSSVVSTALVQKIPAESSKPIGALVIYFNKQALNNMISLLNPYKSGTALMLNDRGELIAVERSGSNKGAETIAMEAAIINELVHKPEKSGSFKHKGKGESYSVSYGYFQRTGWQYVIITPISKLMAPLNLVSRLILGIALITLLVVIIMAWIASKRLYSPINRLLKLFRIGRDGNIALQHNDEIEWIESQWKQLTRESQILQSKLEDKIVSLREGFLYRLCYGHFYHLSESELRIHMEQLGWHVQDRKYTVILFQLSGISNLEGRFSEADEQLITFAASNIIAELMKTNDDYEIDVINLYDLTVGLFVQIPQDSEKKELKQHVYPACEKVMQTLTVLLKLNVAVVHSRVSDHLEDIPQLFDDTRQAMRFRELQAVNQIIHAEEVLPAGDERIDYPFELEKDILKAIRMGFHEEALAYIGMFLQELQHKSGKEILLLQGALQLLGNIQNSILQSGYNPSRIYSGINLYEQLLELRESEEMLRWFDVKVLKPYITELTETQDIKLKQIVESVIVSLEQIYMKDISLEFCADMHDMNSFTLSRAFKKVIGVNFIDYLTDLRLKKSKELLENTNLKISDIAEKVGYQVTYFNRIFKKYENMTPGQFREKYRGDESGS